jgi:hypothetical protein
MFPIQIHFNGQFIFEAADYQEFLQLMDEHFPENQS